MIPKAAASGAGGTSGGLHSRRERQHVAARNGHASSLPISSAAANNNGNRHMPALTRVRPASSNATRKARIRRAIRAAYCAILAILLHSVYSLASMSWPAPVPAIMPPRPNVVFLGIDDEDGSRMQIMASRREARPIQDAHVWKRRRKSGADEGQDDDDYSSDDDDDDHSGRNCQYRHEWQLASYPTCAALHEINMQYDADFTLINNGHYRDVFSYSQTFDGGGSQRMVMKELRFEYDYEFDDADRLESHRRDAVAMGRLTHSDRIPNIYAACANAQIVDVSPEGDLEQHVLAEGESYRNYTSVQKLAIAAQVAEAIADVHQAGIAHTDVAPKQFLLLDGRYQLSDFNRCRFLKEDDQGKQCLFHVGKNPGKGRSPEEYRDDDLSPKIDVYSMGNVYYYMLMGFKYFDGYKTRQAQSIVKGGGRPPLSEEVEQSKDPAIQHIVRGMRRAQAQEAEDRPPAREIAKYLAEALATIAGTDQVVF